jgi:uncharacterized surface protein with fasciclin (FAS1) repeats
MKNYSMMRFGILFFTALTLFTAACNDDNGSNATVPQANIAQIVAQNPNLSTLNAALIRTNLTTALSTGTLTLFAPDNAAFVTAGITDVNAVPVTTLDSILKYHVLGQIVGSTAVPASDTVRTLIGRNIFASRNANGVFVNGYTVKQADIPASNGIIHVINNVLIPPTKTIADIAAADTSFSFLVAAVVKVGLLSALQGPGKYTVFAPTNAAFRAAGITDINAVPLATLTAVVRYHVITTNVFASDLINNATAITLQGGTITTSTIPAAGVKITGSAQPVSLITAANIKATNGVIHVINLIMLP